MFFEQLKKLCDAHGTTPTAVTVKLGFSKGSMSRWKKGSSPTADVVVRFADYFGVSTDRLLRGEENNFKNAKENKKMETSILENLKSVLDIFDQIDGNWRELAKSTGIDILILAKWKKGDFKLEPTGGQISAILNFMCISNRESASIPEVVFLKEFLKSGDNFMGSKSSPENKLIITDVTDITCVQKFLSLSERNKGRIEEQIDNLLAAETRLKEKKA